MLKTTSRKFSALSLTTIFAGLCLFVFCLSNVGAQDALTKRGFQPGGSYALSDIESINTTNGNLMIHLPLASLPEGRGTHPGYKLNLLYNSKLWESKPEIHSDPLNPGPEYNYTHNLVLPSPEGGWLYGFGYTLEIVSRLNEEYVCCNYPQPPALEANYIWKVRMKFPDGSKREFRPTGYYDYLNDGYFNVYPANGMTYYSTDGTYLKLKFEAGENWTMYRPDGGRVTGGPSNPARIYDSNNNYVELQNLFINGEYVTRITDQLGRYIQYQWTSQGDVLTDFSIGGQTLVYTVKWTSTWVYKDYYATDQFLPDPPGNIRTMFYELPVVDEVLLPTQAGGSLKYKFAYNGSSTWPSGFTYGWGELSSMTMPEGTLTNGAQTTYQYFYDGITASTPDLVYWRDVLRNHATQKTLSYSTEFDGAVTPVTETWTYAVDASSGSSNVQEPDGGIINERFFQTYSNPSWSSGLAYRTTKADGTVIDRIWQANIPSGACPYPCAPVKAPNPYVKTEFTSVKNASGTLTKTAIKDYTYDKNGNVTQVAEYDWVDYGTVARDGSGIPTGIPAGATVKRVTTNTYYSSTPVASDTTTYDADAYHLATAPNLRNAIESSEVRSDFSSGSALTRTESYYDSATTTGNLIELRSWDSTKGGLTPTLTSGNSISVYHQYDGYGNETLMTDAKGYQTFYNYGPVGGHTGLYPTDIKTAYQLPIEQHDHKEYDFYTGAVTLDKDVNNHVYAVTTYDVFGRPTLVQEGLVEPGYGTSVERRTATEYSDTARRIIVRKDLNATGDGKIVSIQHYDQLGQLRLSRELENALTETPYDETHGIKTQVRQKFSGSNSYEITSSPYRAALSSGAGSEPGMTWKLTKLDSGGRLLEIETFAGAALPGPWGGNNYSTGKVTTIYDAEYTTVNDQAQKTRRTQVDGLGRLVRVDEPDANGNLGATTSPAQPTYYIYNALGNLTQTSQTGTPNGGSSAITQTRTFTYSSLGRLITANNPENGIVSHEYDANGNLTKKTDARGWFINYTYDELNRNKTLDYSNTAVNPDLSRFYDNPTVGQFGKGKFWYDYAGGNQTTGSSVEHKAVDAYDPLDRVLSVRRQFKNNGTWSSNFTTSQTYGLGGQVLTKTYPSGHTTNYSYDTAGDLSSFSGNLGNGTSRTYSSGILYNAQGQLLREQFGTSTVLYHNRHYNRRGQLYDVRLGTGSDQGTEWTWNRGALRMFYSSDYTDYDPSPSYANNNGNVYRQDHFVPDNDSTSSWSMAVDWYGYDSISRVTGIWEQTYRSNGNNNYATFNQQYSYDRFGNRLVSASNVPNVPTPWFKINGPNNRLIASTDVNGNEGSSDKMQYDAAGNMIKDVHTQLGAGTRTFDAENRMLTAVGPNGLQNAYTYDADGRRTRRSLGNGGEIWWQVFGIDGELVAEYQLVSGTPTLKKEYGYRSGQLLVIADATNSNCQWLVTDALGTPRMIADQTGSLAGMKRRDYLPFGEEMYANAGHRTTSNGYSASQATTPRQQFTGKERDAETGLDYFEARYYGSIYGRFSSPDEFTGGPDELYDFADVASDNPLIYADLVEPQSLNKYQYTYNRPVVLTDPDGHCPICIVVLVGAVIAIAEGPSTVNAPGPNDPVYRNEGPANALISVATAGRGGGQAASGVRKITAVGGGGSAVASNLAGKGKVVLDSNVVIGAIKEGKSQAVNKAIGGRAAVIPRTVIKEVRKKQTKAEVRSFMTSTKAKVAKAGSEAEAQNLRTQATKMKPKRSLKLNDSRVAASAKREKAPVLTYDEKFRKYLEASGIGGEKP